MTTIKTYRCNLCRDAILPTEGVLPREGFGVHFHSHSPLANGAWVTFKRASETETHICLACARAVHDELRKVTPVGCSTACAESPSCV